MRNRTGYFTNVISHCENVLRTFLLGNSDHQRLKFYEIRSQTFLTHFCFILYFDLRLFIFMTKLRKQRWYTCKTQKSKNVFWETSIKRQKNVLCNGNVFRPGKQTQTFWSQSYDCGFDRERFWLVQNQNIEWDFKTNLPIPQFELKKRIVKVEKRTLFNVLSKVKENSS